MKDSVYQDILIHTFMVAYAYHSEITYLFLDFSAFFNFTVYILLFYIAVLLRNKMFCFKLIFKLIEGPFTFRVFFFL